MNYELERESVLRAIEAARAIWEVLEMRQAQDVYIEIARKAAEDLHTALVQLGEARTVELRAHLAGLENDDDFLESATCIQILALRAAQNKDQLNTNPFAIALSMASGRALRIASKRKELVLKQAHKTLKHSLPAWGEVRSDKNAKS